jgi:hypothetical protein
MLAIGQTGKYIQPAECIQFPFEFGIGQGADDDLGAWLVVDYGRRKFKYSIK